VRLRASIRSRIFPRSILRSLLLGDLVAMAPPPVILPFPCCYRV
jgi:hypothetical protein